MAGSSPSPTIFQYDVFLNHRGPDTKEQFLLPLIQKLQVAGIDRPFLDRNVRPGASVFREIDDALASARMHIAVFSGSYAESYYCLTELQAMARTGRPIIPVFYDVAPEHVRRPRNPGGKFEADFRKHSEAARLNPQEVEGWVDALKEVGALKGFVRGAGPYRDFLKYELREAGGNDELLMKDIVANVVQLLSPKTVTIPPRRGEYDWMSHYRLPTKGRGILFFAADTYKNLHITFSPAAGTVFPSYEIVIGLRNSWTTQTRSEIRRHTPERTVCSYSPMDTATDPGREPNDLHHFWIGVDAETKLICVGRGQELREEHAFVIFKDPSFLESVQFIALSSNGVEITYTGIRVESTRPGIFDHASSSGLWSSISASQIRPPAAADVRISSSADHSGVYDWSNAYEIPTRGRGILRFSVKAVGDVQVAISPQPRTVDPMYEIVICGPGSSASSIRKKGQEETLCRFTSIGLIQIGGENQFWVSINTDTQLIHVGQGNQPNLDSAICIYKDPHFVSEARYVSFLSADTRVVYSNIVVASPSATRLLRTQPLEIPPRGGEYDWNASYKFLTEGQGILHFAAKARNDVHVGISPKCATVNPMYEIVIGGWGNSKSCIRRRSQGKLLSFVDGGFLHTRGLNWFWVSIDKYTELIQVGHGNDANSKSILFSFNDPLFLSDAMYIAFSTWDTPIIYSSVSVSFRGATIAKPIRSVPEQSQEPIPWDEDPYFQMMVSQNCHGHYEWQQYFELPASGQGVVHFAAETTTDVHVAISPEPKTVNPMYEVVIGGWNNSQSVIRRAAQGTDLSSSRSGPPIASGVNHYWVSIDASTQMIKAGFGQNARVESSVLLTFRDSNFISGARYVTFTNWDAPVKYSNISLGTI